MPAVQIGQAKLRRHLLHKRGLFGHRVHTGHIQLGHHQGQHHTRQAAARPHIQQLHRCYAALLQAPPELWEALLARDWQRLFLDQRALWAQSRLVVFGHALLEKLVSPYKSITAHVLRWPVPPELGADLSAWDAWLAQAVSADRLQAKPFTPLPVLGVPGWWPANADPAFYADTTVFRPPRA